MEDRIIYKDLSFKIVGFLFEVYNALGFGFQEKIYEKAIESLFIKNNIMYKRQAPYKVVFNDKEIAKYYIDYVVEDKIVLELKQGNNYSKANMNQILGYLKITGYKLAIIANFTANGVKFYRMLNPNNKN